MSSTPRRRSRRVDANQLGGSAETQTEQFIVPYDENLLERARTQWQFGDWRSLAALEREMLQHHPDRAKLALLAAAGCLQTDQLNQARQYLRLALDWGCSHRLISQILAAGVHNSLGRAAALAGQQARALKHFECSIVVGTPGSDANLLSQARATEQVRQLSLPGQQLKFSGQPSLPIVASDTEETPVAYLFSIKIRLGTEPPVMLGLNTSKKDWLEIQQDAIEYHTEKGAPLYLVSNADGNFERAPSSQQLSITPDTAYILSGVIAHQGENQPVVWVFQYSEGKKIDAQSIKTDVGRFHYNFRSLPATDSMAIGIRLAGNGNLSQSGTLLTLKEQTNEEFLTYFEQKIEKLEQAQKRDVENSMKQIESCIRLQHYLGTDIILPDMHNWPISPDFGVFLINLVEQNEYDAVIEFGSGTSTLILAKALERVGRRNGGQPAPLLSFDHLEKYGEKTQKLIKAAGLTEHVRVVVAPLVPWKDESGEFSYYACEEALRSFKHGLTKAASRLLVILDGPPAATGKYARYPALPKVLDVFSGSESVQFLLDDYLRKEEQEIAGQWLELLTKQKVRCTRNEINNLEKKACLIEVSPNPGGGLE